MIDSSLNDSNTSAPRGGGVRLGVHIHRLKSLMARCWWIVALTILAGLAVEGYRCANMIVRYGSSARMMVNGHLSIPQGEIYSEELTNFYGTQAAMMKSADTLARAIAQLQATHPEITIDPGATVEAFQEARTSIFDLQVVSTSPEYARALLDAAMDTYLALKHGRKTETTHEAVSAIAQEIAKLDSEIKADEQQLLDFQKENDIVYVEEQSTSTGNYLVELNNEMARLTKEHDLLSLENASGAVESGIGASIANPQGSPAGTDLDSGGPSSSGVQQQEQNLAKLTILQKDLSKYLRPKHPKMVALADTIAQEMAFQLTLESHDKDARLQHQKVLELEIQNLQQQIADWTKKSLDMSQRLGTYEQLKSKVTREQSLYSQLASSIQNVNVNQSIDQEDVAVMDAASPASAIRPDYARELTYGAVFGALVGLAVIYLINRLDDKIDSPLEMEENFGFPLVGQIPRAILDKQTQRVPLLADRDRRHVLSESYRNIRSSLLFRSESKEKFRSILISSASPGEGKSTLAANLAVTFAFAGSRILLIDADLRRGVLHDLFEVPQSPGLSDFLQQKLNWREAIQKTKMETLDLLPRGKVPHHPGELLLGPVASLLIKESALEYDVVIWDSAPLLATDDAANLCSKMDGVLFVVRARNSSIHSISCALDILSKRGASIVGLILNAVEPDQPGYYDRYRYKQYYTTEAEA